jgi:hypothetical protein
MIRCLYLRLRCLEPTKAVKGRSEALCHLAAVKVEINDKVQKHFKGLGMHGLLDVCQHIIILC